MNEPKTKRPRKWLRSPNPALVELVPDAALVAPSASADALTPAVSDAEASRPDAAAPSLTDETNVALMAFAEGYEPTVDEARAELEEDGVDVGAFVARGRERLNAARSVPAPNFEDAARHAWDVLGNRTDPLLEGLTLREQRELAASSLRNLAEAYVMLLAVLDEPAAAAPSGALASPWMADMVAFAAELEQLEAPVAAEEPASINTAPDPTLPSPWDDRARITATEALASVGHLSGYADRALETRVHDALVAAGFEPQWPSEVGYRAKPKRALAAYYTRPAGREVGGDR